MNHADIIRMAKESGFLFQDAGYAPEIMHTEPHEYSQKCFERFAALVAAAEREACLQIADYCADANMPASMAANAIRARGIE